MPIWQCKLGLTFFPSNRTVQYQTQGHSGALCRCSTSKCLHCWGPGFGCEVLNNCGQLYHYHKLVLGTKWVSTLYGRTLIFDKMSIMPLPFWGTLRYLEAAIQRFFKVFSVEKPNSMLSQRPSPSSWVEWVQCAKITDYMTPSSGMWKLLSTLEDNNNIWQSAQWGGIKRGVERRAMSWCDMLLWASP